MGDKVLPCRDGRRFISATEDAGSDDFFELLSSHLSEAASFPDEDAPGHDVHGLLEENARLRALAVVLSDLVGNLPDREWRHALASADLATLDRVRSSRA